MKHLKTALIGSLVGGGMLMSGQALATVIDGVSVPEGSVVQVGTVSENPISGVGDTLSGSGTVTSISSPGQENNPGTDFCAGCTLHFDFDGYKVDRLEPGSNGQDSQIDFTGGNVTFTVNHNDGSTDTFLTAVGHKYKDAASGRTGTLLGSGSNLTSANAQGTGVGQMDVTGGDAADLFNGSSYSDELGGFSNLLFNSSFSPGEDDMLSGSIDIHSMENVSVPGPGALGLGLMGLSLIGLGFVTRRIQGRKANMA
jgi:hypothetical protein